MAAVAVAVAVAVAESCHQVGAAAAASPTSARSPIWLLCGLAVGRSDLEATNDPCLHRQRVWGGENDSDSACDYADRADEACGDQHKPGDQGVDRIRATSPDDGANAQSGCDSPRVCGKDHGGQ